MLYHIFTYFQIYLGYQNIILYLCGRETKPLAMHKSKKNNVLRVDTEQKPNLLHKNSYRNVYGKNITYITDITHFVRLIGLGVPIV